mgnify:FL=1
MMVRIVHLVSMKADRSVSMKVLLADDESSVRSALRLLLNEDQDLEIVAEAFDARSLLLQTKLTQPDLVLLDWELPGFRNPDLLLSLSFLFPSAKVVVLSGRPEAGTEALAAGADAFVSKSEPPESLLRAVNSLKL